MPPLSPLLGHFRHDPRPARNSSVATDPRADLRWRRVSVEAFVAEANLPEVVLRKLMLAHEHAAELLQILRRENVSRSALTPTMDNVSKDVWKWLTR